MKCKKCGRVIDSDSFSFCPHCGSPAEIKKTSLKEQDLETVAAREAAQLMLITELMSKVDAIESMLINSLYIQTGGDPNDQSKQQETANELQNIIATDANKRMQASHEYILHRMDEIGVALKNRINT